MGPDSIRSLGVISDTHGLLRPEALEALRGCELIIHAGDVGDPRILEALRDLAPVHAVRGNIDTGAWARELPETAEVRLASARIWVLHDLHRLVIDPAAEGFHAVISGHSHKPVVEKKNGVVFLNPGSAGPRRFRLPISLARCEIQGSSIRTELIDLG
jgi:putative phosphoesterase